MVKHRKILNENTTTLMPSLTINKIQRLLSKNKKLRKQGKKIIQQLNQTEWPSNGIAAKDMPARTDLLWERVFTTGMAGGMASLLSVPILSDYVIPFVANYFSFLQDQRAKDDVLYGMILLGYGLGIAAATKLSYQSYLPFNIFSDRNKLNKLHLAYKANCAELKILTQNKLRV